MALGIIVENRETLPDPLARSGRLDMIAALTAKGIKPIVPKESDSKHGANLGEGAFCDDPLETFGGAGVVKIPRLQKLLRYICENGFEQHVAVNFSRIASAVNEATPRYLRQEVHADPRRETSQSNSLESQG